jgi:hypothetical protein
MGLKWTLILRDTLTSPATIGFLALSIPKAVAIAGHSRNRKSVSNCVAQRMEFGLMFSYCHGRLLAVLTVLVGALLSGCAPTTPSQVAKDITRAAVVGFAESEYVNNCVDFPKNFPGKSISSCEQRFEDYTKLGQSVYEELQPSEDSSDAAELSRQLDEFIERRSTPESYREDSGDEVPSPQVQ